MVRDLVEFCSAQKPPQEEWQIDPPAEFWQARVTGQTGRSNNVEWLSDGEKYSFTGVSKEILNQLVGRPHEKALNGYKYWCHPEFESPTLSDLRNSGESASGRSNN